jgi:hypothetical protein
MNLKHIKEEIKGLKKKCIEEVDYHFNKYVLDDLVDYGEVYSLIDDIDLYGYWCGNALQINFIINSLLSDTSNESKEKEEILIQLIGIKRVIDTKLLELRIEDKDQILSDLGIRIKSMVNPFLQLNVDEKIKEKTINNFHELLVQHGLISNSIDEFKQHFYPSSSIIKPIDWKETQIQLVGLLKEMIEKKFLIGSSKQLSSIIKKHFTHKGTAIKEGNISVYSSNIININSDKKFDKIVPVIIELKKLI